MAQRRYRIALVILSLALAVLAVWPPVSGAQTTPPAATAVPVVTPTRTAAELSGVDEQTATAGELLRRYGWLGAPGLLLVGVAFFLLVRYWSGLGKTVEKIGERHAEGALRAAEAPVERRAAAARRQGAEAAYLGWLQEELRHLPIIPIRSTERQEQLLVAEVYIRLRVVERAQIEGFRKLVRGDFDPEGEYGLRREA